MAVLTDGLAAALDGLPQVVVFEGEAGVERSKGLAAAYRKIAEAAGVSFFDQPARVTRFKLVHAVWRRQRMEVQFADGRKVTNLDMYPFVPEELPPALSSMWRLCRLGYRHEPGLLVAALLLSLAGGHWFVEAVYD